MRYSLHLLHHLRFTIGQNIHRQRLMRKLPLRRLSRLSGVRENLIDQYELGKNEIALDELLTIACALDMKVESLISTENSYPCLMRG